MGLREQVGEFRIFQDLAGDEIDMILDIGEETTHKLGDILVEESEHVTDSEFFIIVKGMVKVEIEGFREEGTGASKRLAVLKGGDVFGERSLLQGHHRTARVSAYGDLTVVRVNSGRLRELLEDNHRLGWLLMRNLAAVLSDRLVTLNFMWRDAT